MSRQTLTEADDEPEKYLPLLKMLAYRMTAAHHDPYLRQELIQAGYIGIIRASRRYDPERGARFTTYAVPWILGEMRAALRNSLDTDKRYEDIRRLNTARKALKEKMLREPTVNELCSVLGIEPYMLFMLDAGNQRVSIDDERYNDILQHNMETDHSAEGLEDAVAKLDPQAQELIRLRYYSDKTQRETAQLLGKSQSAVSKAEQRALSSLRNLIVEDRSG